MHDHSGVTLEVNHVPSQVERVESHLGGGFANGLSCQKSNGLAGISLTAVIVQSHQVPVDRSSKLTLGASIAGAVHFFGT